MSTKATAARRVLISVMVAAIGVSASYAFTASNTVPATKAGDGSNTITGFAVSAVHYALDAANPDLIDSVAFTLDTAPVAGSTVKAQLVTAGTWYSCTMTGANASCDTADAPVTPTNNLRVVAAQ